MNEYELSQYELNEDIHQYPIKKSLFNNPSLFSVQGKIQIMLDESSIEFDSNFSNSYFDRIYCINLNKRIHKWESAKLRLEQQNINANRFEAIDGQLFAGVSNMTTGEIGCLCSHLEVIKHAKVNNYKKILIFEDDVHLSKDFKEKIILIQKLRWKMVYLGASQYDWTDVDPSSGFYLSKKSLGTFAYAVDYTLFDDLIAALSDKTKPVDKILQEIQELYYGECYTFYPNIAIADVRTSDIRGKRDIISHSEKMKWELSNFPMFDKKIKKVLLIPDARGWAFDNIAKSIVKYNPFPDKICYDILYCRDLYLERVSLDIGEWDYVYVMFEGESIIPPAKNVIRGCYSAFWLENQSYTPEYMSQYFVQCGGAVFANDALKDRFSKYLPENFPTEIIQDASDENVFYPIKYRKHKEFTVLYVGNTRRPIKNFGMIEKICKEADVTLKVCRNVPNSDMVHEYNKANLIINFSEFEGGPQTFVEAALCEIPMLIRDTNELAKNIPCFVGKTPEDFVNILNRLKNNHEECQKKGEEAYKVAIERFTYRRVAKRFAEFFLSFEKKNLRDRLTVFVVNAGNNPNYEDCVDSVYNQTCTFQTKFINDVAPMSKAFQRMIDSCATPYYVQVDGDMILDPTAVETIYNTLVSSENNIAIVAYMLKDAHLNFDIYGVKGYKHDVLRKYPYNLEIISCEVEQINRMTKDGYKTDMIEKVLGIHSPKWTNELIYERYFDLMEKWKIYKYHWVGKLPAKLLAMFKNDPSEINFFALVGTLHSLSTDESIRKREKDFSIKNDNVERLKKMYL